VREEELKRHHWRSKLEGASVKSFFYTRESGFKILQVLPPFNEVHKRSLLLSLQNEIKDRGLLLKETSAGIVLAPCM